jgi:hypothetical protein
VRNIVCLFVRSATSRASAPGAFATGYVRETYGAVNFLLLRIMQVKPFWGVTAWAAILRRSGRGGGPDGGCDGQRGNASVLTKGMNPAARLAGDASAIPHWSPPTDRLVASATRVSVERRPEHCRIAGAARPGGVPAALTEAGLVTDEDSARAERVAIGASRGWVGDPSSGRGLHEVAEHPIA